MIEVASVKKKWTIYISITIALLLMAAHRLEIGIFSPKRPLSLPSNAIWIAAPPLPFAAAHGWWLGCEKQDAEFDKCTLIGHSDRQSGGDGRNRIVSSESYLSCRTLGPLKTEDIVLKKPPGSMDMWVNKVDSNKQWIGMAPAAFLQNGDILVPASEMLQCSKFLKASAETSASP
jgi:hypothetical protein